jgi:YesN/AraC family two-component response regulator
MGSPEVSATVGACRVLIVDDEDDIRALLRVVLADGSGAYAVVGEAVNGHEAVERWREQQPDVVLLDQRMPGLTGLEAAEQILAEAPGQLIILFSAFLTDTMTERATALGIAACVAKEDVFSVPSIIDGLLGST